MTLTFATMDDASQRGEWIAIRNQIAWKLLVQANQGKDLIYKKNSREYRAELSEVAKQMNCSVERLGAIAKSLVMTNYKIFCNTVGLENNFQNQIETIDNLCWDLFIFRSKKRGFCLKSKKINFADKAKEMGFDEADLKRFTQEYHDVMMQDYLDSYNLSQEKTSFLSRLSKRVANRFFGNRY